MLRTGQSLGNYEVGEVIGEGGFATVYEGHHRALGHRVAIKVLHPTLSRDASIRARFRDEARILASLDHPGIVKVFDFHEDEELCAFILEYLDGMPLDKLLREQPRWWTLELGAQMMGQVLDAIHYAHTRSEPIIHRDLKPSNIFIKIGERGIEARVMDFGVARILGTTTDRRTRTGTVVGSLHYMSPEQIEGRADLDARADLYAMGVVLYEVMTGQVPFDADSDFHVMQSHMVETPKRPCEVNPSLPTSLEPVILKVLAKAPDARFNHAAAFRGALLKVLEGIPDAIKSVPVVRQPINDVSAPLGYTPPAPGTGDSARVSSTQGAAARRNQGRAPTVAESSERILTTVESSDSSIHSARMSSLDQAVLKATGPQKPVTKLESRKPATKLERPIRPSNGPFNSADSFNKEQPPAPRKAGGVLRLVMLLMITVVVVMASVMVFGGFDLLLPKPQDDQASSRDHNSEMRTKIKAATANDEVKDSLSNIVQVSGGSFLMGCQTGQDRICPQSAWAKHQVELDAFGIDRTEVSWLAYKKCVSDGACSTPKVYRCDVPLVHPRGEVGPLPMSFQGKNQPVVCVTWSQARQYCQWVGGDLPTEAQWEKAARGNKGQPFPWGSADPTCELAVMRDHGRGGCDSGTTLSVTSKSRGKSPYGALNMAGNVWEWTRDWYASNPSPAPDGKNPTGPSHGTEKVSKGGAYLARGRYGFLSGASRNKAMPSLAFSTIGFRCAYGSQPKSQKVRPGKK